MGRGQWGVNLLRVSLLVLLLSDRAFASEPEPKAPRQSFLVAPFANRTGQRTLDLLQGGLPVLVAERMAMHPALRFAGTGLVIERGGTEQTLARAAAGQARWVIGGHYEKQPDWKIAVTVEIYAVGGPGGEKVSAGQSVLIGTKEEVARTALRATLEALAKAGLAPEPDAAARAAILAPFARDPYAFVLYARGVSAHAGLDGYGASVERAMRNLTRALSIDPRVPEARRYLGAVHLAAGRPAQARASWSHAVDVRPDYPLALAGLAALDRTAGLPSARERYARVLDLDPDDLEARRSYGELLADAGALVEARRELLTVVQARPGDLRARRALALVLASQQAGVALAAELAEVVRLDPEDLDARLELAAAYNAPGVGRAADAIATYEEVLRRRPRHPVALKLLADLLRGKGEAARAVGYYERLRRVAPDDPRPLFLLATAYAEAGRPNAAERMFLEAARIPGVQADAYSNLGALAYRRGQVKEALWFLSRAARRRAGKADVRFNYGVALLAAARPADARSELAAAVTLAPEDPEIHFVSGVVALRLGQTQEAAAQFREAVRLDPRHEKARHNLALLDSLKGPASERSFMLAK